MDITDKNRLIELAKAMDEKSIKNKLEFFERELIHHKKDIERLRPRLGIREDEWRTYHSNKIDLINEHIEILNSALTQNK